jgi:hypothetical protein
MSSFRVSLERDDHVIEATDAHDARMQTLQMLAEDPSLIQVESTVTTFQWLIERGQPEGEVSAVWLEHGAYHVAAEGRWTKDANQAAMFPDRQTAEAWIAEQGLDARAVEHGFIGWVSA